jgi:transitional endoplasmic reticulum ATPase
MSMRNIGKKTHFAKAIAGVLAWWYIEIEPSMLMAEGVEKVGANLREIMRQARNLNDAVLFIDEFEEIAGSRDKADRIDKSITNEFLKQIPLLKSQANNILLVCATNYIRQLDTAMLRPGRFDCVMEPAFSDLLYSLYHRAPFSQVHVALIRFHEPFFR